MRRFDALAARFSLRARLTLLAALGATLVLPVGVLLLQGGLSDALDDALTKELRIRADDVASELRAGDQPILGNGPTTQVLAAGGEVLDPAGAEPMLQDDELAAARTGEVVVDRDVAEVGGPGRVLARPVGPTGDDGGVVAVAESRAPIDSARDRLAVVLGIVGPVLVLLVTATAWTLARAALRPAQLMTRRAETISLQEPGARLPQPPGKDEIAELGRTLNRMLDRIEEAIAHERAFVDDASHELRTPIAVLRGELELARLELADGSDAAESIGAIDSALEETDRLARVAEHLLVLARADAGRLAEDREPVDLLAATARAVDRLRLERVRLEVRGTEAVVMASADLIDRVLINLLTNAARFASGRVQVTVQGDGIDAVLAVADDGPGFAPDLLDRALDRFSRSEPARSRARGGTGLGLAIVAAIVDAFDGRVTLANNGPLGGAVVEIRLPRAVRGTG